MGSNAQALLFYGIVFKSEDIEKLPWYNNKTYEAAAYELEQYIIKELIKAPDLGLTREQQNTLDNYLYTNFLDNVEIGDYNHEDSPYLYIAIKDSGKIVEGCESVELSVDSCWVDITWKDKIYNFCKKIGIYDSIIKDKYNPTYTMVAYYG